MCVCVERPTNSYGPMDKGQQLENVSSNRLEEPVLFDLILYVPVNNLSVTSG